MPTNLDCTLVSRSSVVADSHACLWTILYLIDHGLQIANLKYVNVSVKPSSWVTSFRETLSRPNPECDFKALLKLSHRR